MDLCWIVDIRTYLHTTHAGRDRQRTHRTRSGPNASTRSSFTPTSSPPDTDASGATSPSGWPSTSLLSSATETNRTQAPHSARARRSPSPNTAPPGACWPMLRFFSTSASASRRTVASTASYSRSPTNTSSLLLPPGGMGLPARAVAAAPAPAVAAVLLLEEKRSSALLSPKEE